MTTYDGFASGNTNFYVPTLFKAGGTSGTTDLALYVQNVNQANAASITMKFYDTTGAIDLYHD